MGRKCTQFIRQNTAPQGAKRIGIYDENGNRLFGIPLGGLTPVKKEKLYSFGIVSDTHMAYNKTSGISSYTNPNDPTTVGTNLEDGNGLGIPPNGTNLRNAFNFMSEYGTEFICNCGDLTNIGFYWERGDTEMFVKQFQEYRDICALFPHIPVYNVMGNHESYNANITDNLGDLEEYTGAEDIAYHFERGNDVFIFVGQSSNTVPMTDAHLQWLAEKLTEFKHRRCFVFIHSFMRDDSGAACNARNNDIFSMSWGTTKTDNFKKMLAGYPNVILFHGHSHMKFESQEHDKNATYTEKNGFKSVHIPSLGDPRKLLNITGAWEEDKWGGQFYIADVHEDCVVLNGYYVYRENTTVTSMKIMPIMIGTYKIDIGSGNLSNTDDPSDTGNDSFTNLIPISTNANDTLFVGENGEAGYKIGYRIKSSTGEEEVSNGASCTGFMPVNYGDTIYVKNISAVHDGISVLCLYDSNHNYLFGSYLTQFLKGNTTSSLNGEVANMQLVKNNWGGGYTDIDKGIAYFRISAIGLTENSIITVNQSIDDQITE